jgi:alpha-galactosidase
VPFVGRKSENWERFKGKYLFEDRHHGAWVLDPRFPEVRKFLVDTYVAAMKEWGLDGFKLDFIDSFRFNGKDPAVAEDYAGRDIRSLPDAVNRLMMDVYAALSAENPDVLIEFRQKYIGPTIRQFGNMMRATDCPGDMQLNRQRIANLRLTAGRSAVHGDMLEWHPTDTPEGAALPILSSMFGVIQYSMMLRCLPESHREVIRHWLKFSQEHRDTLMKGRFRAYNPESQYPILEAESEAERIIGVYSSGRVVSCGALDRPVYILNGTLGDSVVLDTKCDATAEAFDTFGKSAGKRILKSGVQRVKIPKGGYLVINNSK